MLRRMIGLGLGVLVNRAGVAAAEYAILAVGIVIVVGTAVSVLNDPVTSAWAIMGRAVQDGQASLMAMN